MVTVYDNVGSKYEYPDATHTMRNDDGSLDVFQTVKDDKTGYITYPRHAVFCSGGWLRVEFSQSNEQG